MSKKKYGEPEQIKRVKAEIEDIERMISSKDETARSDVGYFEHSAKRLDVDEVKKSLAMKRKMLQNMTPTKFNPRQANEAYRYAKQLKQKIIENMPQERYVSYPRGQDPVSKTKDFEDAINRQVAWTKAGWPKKIELFNNIMKRIDPEHRWTDFNEYVKERA